MNSLKFNFQFSSYFSGAANVCIFGFSLKSPDENGSGGRCGIAFHMHLQFLQTSLDANICSL